MMPAAVFWGVLFGGMYFLAMWWIRTQRLNDQRRQTRTLYSFSEQIVAGSISRSNRVADGRIAARLVGGDRSHALSS